ncbi:DUF1365 domain-containing protein [Bacteriovoracaceae bacterium]|nr:DUF1365 domain-containing protein [Bacteriovoracaceae bacterium]
MNPLEIVPYQVTHERFVPKRYKFTHNFFWFKVPLDNLSALSTWLVGFGKKRIYSFLDQDHLKLGKETARENYIEFARRNGLESEISKVTLYTSLRFMGYVFNPVSFVLLEDIQGKEHAIIEIGNTFNEQKPYFVHNKYFSSNGFAYKTKKYFYISPFIPHDYQMTFVFKKIGNSVGINIIDQGETETVLKVSFSGKEKLATTKEIIKQTLRVPFVTLKAIILIHFHAFILWVKGIKYFKKNEEKHLQRGTYLWKL